MNYKIIGSRNIGFHAPGSVLSKTQIEAAGGSVSHLIASGHIVAHYEEPVAKARKATSVTQADEAETVEEQ
jgi:hypothetical protein